MDPIFGDEIKFHPEGCDIDNDLMLQWSIDTCFGNGIYQLIFQIQNFKLSVYFRYRVRKE